MTRWLVVMVKEPRPGRVKTRLAKGVGPVAAAWWFRHQTGRLLRRLRDPRWRLILAVAPDRAGLESRVWPGDLARIPQGQGDLGDRMGRIVRSLPPGPVLVVGADIPGLGKAEVARAFAALGRSEAVIGPAPDGGYWGIGLRRTRAVPAGVFRGVRWSSAHAAADTRRSLAPLTVTDTDMLRDVDEPSDLAGP